jgi:hypothetical protein
MRGRDKMTEKTRIESESGTTPDCETTPADWRHESTLRYPAVRNKTVFGDGVIIISVLTRRFSRV